MAYIDQYGVQFSDDKKVLKRCPKHFKGTYVVPNSVTKIRWFAFSRCSGLTSIEIPNSVIKIGWGAFDGCSSLKQIIVPVGQKERFSKMEELEDDTDRIIELNKEQISLGVSDRKRASVVEQVDLATADFDIVIEIEEKGKNADAEVKTFMHIIDVYSKGSKNLLLIDLGKDTVMQCCDFFVRGKRYFFTFVLKNNHIQDYLFEKIMSNGNAKLIAAKRLEKIGSPDYISFIPRAEWAETEGMGKRVKEWISF